MTTESRLQLAFAYVRQARLEAKPGILNTRRSLTRSAKKIRHLLDEAEAHITAAICATQQDWVR